MIARYAALGDSLSAGGEGQPWAPWPRLLVPMLERGAHEVSLSVLARAGSTAGRMHDEQLAAAVAWRPDLVTVTSGANDVLLAFRPDVAAAGLALERTLTALRADLPAARVLVLTYPLFVELPYRRRSKRRVLDGMRELNEAVRAISRRTGAALVDLERDPAGRLHGCFCGDGIHPSAAGHRRIARCVRAVAQPATAAGAPTIAPMSASSSPDVPATFT
jgi:lysophospholipase L1-like esterase